MIEIAITIVWYIIGVIIYIYQWLRDFDFTTKDVPLALVYGLFGPITYLILWLIDNEYDRESIIFKARKK